MFTRPRGEPKTLFMKLENPPLFFFHGAELFPPLASSEYRFELDPESERVGVMSESRSPTEKLADCLSAGAVIRDPGAVCESGGGAGRRKGLE